MIIINSCILPGDGSYLLSFGFKRFWKRLRCVCACVYIMKLSEWMNCWSWCAFDKRITVCLCTGDVKKTTLAIATKLQLIFLNPFFPVLFFKLIFCWIFFSFCCCWIEQIPNKFNKNRQIKTNLSNKSKQKPNQIRRIILQSQPQVNVAEQYREYQSLKGATWISGGENRIHLWIYAVRIVCPKQIKLQQKQPTF